MIGLLVTRVAVVESENPAVLAEKANERIAEIEQGNGDVLSVQVQAVPVALIGEEARRYGVQVTLFTAWIVYRVPVTEVRR